jgi:hypothetical protein
MAERPFAAPAGDGVRLIVRVTPRGGRDRVDGILQLADGQEVLAVRVSAPPDDGKANAALIATLARFLGSPARDLEIVAGATSRLKTVRVNSPYEVVQEKVRLLLR